MVSRFLMLLRSFLISLLLGLGFAQMHGLRGITTHSMNVSAVDGRRLRTSFNGVNPLNLDGPSTEFYTLCVFPISGQYGFIPRILYYAFLAFAVFGRSHEWLAAGALASAMSYAGFAAIHALILVSTYRFTRQSANVSDPYLFGDFDMTAIWAVLTAGWYITVPLLRWSSAPRKFNARPVVIYWSLFIAIGAVCAAASTIKAPENRDGLALYWQGAAVICSSIPKDERSRLQYDDPVRLYFSSPQIWNHYNCTTQCGSLSSNMVMRPRTQMVPLVQPEFVDWVQPNRLPLNVITINLFWALLPPVILSYVYALWSDGQSPAEARNSICALIVGYESNSCSRLRRFVAVSHALIVYVYALLMLIACPLLFFLNMFYNEWFLIHIPQDEPVTAFGQWAPVVSAILVMTSVSLTRVHLKMLHPRGNLLQNLNRRLCRRRVSLDQTPSSLENSDNHRKALVCDIKTDIHDHPGHSVRSVVSHLFGPFLRALECSQIEWHDFQHWIHDPVNSSILQNTRGLVEREIVSQVPTLPPNV